MAIHHGAGQVGPQVRDEVLALLREDLRILACCADLSYPLSLARSDDGSRQNMETLSTLIGAVKEISRVEEDIQEHEHTIRGGISAEGLGPRASAHFR